MVWLISIIFILQFVFYWLLKPAIVTFTPFFELRGAAIIGLILIIWLFSGRAKED